MTCPRCSAVNAPDARFCEDCGARLDLVCPACGQLVTPGKRFCRSCGAAIAPRPTPTPAAYTPPHLAERILRTRAALTGERKQVSVLFADVSGFTSLSEQLDPEDVHALINRAFELMLAEIHRYEGTVNQFLGDGLMALFGAPLALEDHAQRAAHAALAMQRALAGYRDELHRARGIDFRLRMGLNTGLVVVGAIGDNLRMDYTAVGDTTNIAARMQQLAEPGQIVAAETTERLIAPYFELASLGTVTVKNRAQPVAAWLLHGARAAVSRLATRAERGLSPLVGRDDNLATLQQAWTLARAGRGQVAFVVGDAGIGKSRLLHELRERVAGEATWLQGDAISYGRSMPFLPVIALLKGAFGIGDEHGERDVIARIRDGLSPLGPDAGAGEPFLRYLLSVDAGDAAVVAMEPVQRRGRVVAAVQRFTGAAARLRPVVLVVEDAHWIDGASEDVLRSLVDSAPGMALLLIISYRPTYQQPFGDRTYYWRIALQPVGAEDAVRIVGATLGVAGLPGELAATIARRADGNPFFLEEIGRALLESGAVRRESGHLVLARPASAVVVPETVQDVIAARLDQLDELQKRTVQTAAVIGREFGLELLRRVSEDRERLEQSVSDLSRMELIYEKLTRGEPDYVFKHALTQDVAYGSLLQAERRRLHAMIGRAIEELFPARLEERREELVLHFSRGEVWDRALHYAREAADRAAALCVDDRAVEFYEVALEAVRHLPDSPEQGRTEVEIRLAMRAPLWRAGRLDRLHESFKHAETLATGLGMAEALDTIFTFFVQYYWAKGQQSSALQYGERCLRSAEARADVALAVTTHYYVGHAHHALGAYAPAVDHLARVVELLEGGRASERFGMSGLPYCSASALGASALSCIGDRRALQWLERGRKVATGEDHLYSRVGIQIRQGEALLTFGTPADAIEVLEPALTICRDKRFAGMTMGALQFLGHARALSGAADEAVRLLVEGCELKKSTNSWVEFSSLYWILADGHCRLGQLDAARTAARQALELADRHGEAGHAAQAWLVLGQVAEAAGDDGRAREAMHAALERATALRMRPLVGKAHLALARLQQSLAEHEKARQHRSTARAIFADVGMPFWLEQAKAVD